MTKIKEKDFVEIEYIGRIKETNQIFDLTDENLAKKEKIHNPNAKYGPRIICLGEKQTLEAIDKALLNKETGEKLTIDIKPEEGFGNKDPKLIKIISAEILRKQKINPFPGLQINASGLMGTIRSVTGGRVTVDFNHPLSGKNLTYEIKINRIVDKDDEKLKSLVENMLGLSQKDYTISIESKKAKIKIKPTIPTPAKDEFKTKAKQLIPALEVSFG